MNAVNPLDKQTYLGFVFIELTKKFQNIRIASSQKKTYLMIEGLFYKKKKSVVKKDRMYRKLQGPTLTYINNCSLRREMKTKIQYFLTAKLMNFQ